MVQSCKLDVRLLVVELMLVSVDIYVDFEGCLRFQAWNSYVFEKRIGQTLLSSWTEKWVEFKHLAQEIQDLLLSAWEFILQLVAIGFDVVLYALLVLLNTLVEDEAHVFENILLVCRY